MRRLLCLLLLSAFSLHAENYPVLVRLSAQADEKEGDTFTVPVVLPHSTKKIFVRKVPIITERDIISFYPFPAGDGSIGCYFKLDADGTTKLEQHTTAYRDTLVVASVNGRVTGGMMVDKKIKDGIMLVPSGFLPMEIAGLQTKYPTMGSEKDFKAQKKKAEQSIKEAKKNAPKPTPKPKATN